MFITSEHILASEIAYRQERIAADWTAANAHRTSRAMRRRPRRRLLMRLPVHPDGNGTTA